MRDDKASYDSIDGSALVAVVTRRERVQDHLEGEESDLSDNFGQGGIAVAMSNRLTRRRLIRIGVATAGTTVLTALVGCQPVVEVTKPVVEATKPVETTPSKTITIWASSVYAASPEAGTASGIFAKYVKLFTDANPDFKVEVVDIGTTATGSYAKLAGALATGTAGDLLDVAADLQRHAAAGHLMVLDDIVRSWGRTDTYQAAIDPFMWEGKQYGVPYIGNPRCLSYRKDFFEEAGLDPEKPPATWDDLIEMGPKLVKHDEDGVMTRASFWISPSTFVADQVLWANGGEYFDSTGTQPLLNTPEAIEAWQFARDTIFKYELAPKGGINPSNNRWFLFNDKLAIDGEVGPAEMVLFRNNNPDHYDDVALAMPLGNKRRASFAGFQSWQINAKTKYPEDVAALMYILTGDDFQVEINEFFGVLPVQAHLAETAPYIVAEPRYKIAMDSYQYCFAEPAHIKWIPIRDTVVKQLMEALVISDQPDVKTLADQAQAAAEKILKEE